VSTFVSKSAGQRSAVQIAIDEAPEVGLGMLLRAADNAFNRVLRLKLAKHGVSFSEFQHLRQLWDEEGLNQVEVSRRIGIERASSTAVIESLLRKSLIRRSRDATDKRKILVYLTPRGAALRNKLWPCAIETNTLAYAGLGSGQRRALFQLLSAVTENLNKAESEL
jgi:DNA-binding MarR family transcriptional regulator